MVTNASSKTKTEVEQAKTTNSATNNADSATYTSYLGVIDGLKLPWKNVETDDQNPHIVTANTDFPIDADTLHGAVSNPTPIKAYDP